MTPSEIPVNGPPWRALWVVPELQGGIQTYGDALFPAVADATQGRFAWTRVGPECIPNGTLPDADHHGAPSVNLIHIQHEYALFGGSKLPWRYHFVRTLRSLRLQFPRAKIVLTAHTVLPGDYRFNEQVGPGRGLARAIRWLANRTILPWMRPFWFQKTFGAVDGVIVHSSKQVQTIQKSGCAHVVAIPHFVYARNQNPLSAGAAIAANDVVVFGYFTPEKGQDIAILAWALFRERHREQMGEQKGEQGGEAVAHRPQRRLILAGGVRRPEDQAYYDSCVRLIADLELKEEVEITGYLPESEVGAIYSRAALVLAPFRETSGSGSLARGFAQGAALLVSDLALNREIAERVPGAVEFFRAEDAQSCADQIDALVNAPERQAALRHGAERYAERYGLAPIARAHAEFYALLAP